MPQNDLEAQIDYDLSKLLLDIAPFGVYMNDSYKAGRSTYGILNDGMREAMSANPWSKCKLGEALDTKLK
jgi:hypothetical protein